MHYGLSVICLRLGWVALSSDMEWMTRRRRRPPGITLTERDCCEIIAHSLEAKDVDFAVLQAFSQNAAGFRDLSLMPKVIGYAPQDDAYKLFEMGRLVGSEGPDK
jgi:hypothetical protein